MKNNKQDNAVEKRRLMYSQIFSPNTTYRDGSRTIDVSAAVESGAKTTDKVKVSILTVAIIVVLCILWSLFGNSMIKGISNFIASQKNTIQIELEEPDGILFDVDKFLTTAQTGYVSPYHDNLYDVAYSYKMLYEWKDVPLIGEKFSKNELLSLRTCNFKLNTEGNKIGFFELLIGYEDAEQKSSGYSLIGRFKIEGYSEDVTLLDHIPNATFTYQRSDGQTAYFVRNWLYGTYTLYFVDDGIYYEMELDASDYEVECAKKIFEAFVG